MSHAEGPPPRAPRSLVILGLVLAAAGIGCGVAATALVLGDDRTESTASAPSVPPPTGGAGTGGAGGVDGAQVFTDAGCGACHTFTPADAGGQVGPSLDDTSLDAAAIEQTVTEGRAGGMPSFAGRLSPEQIQAVAEYVAAGAGG